MTDTIYQEKVDLEQGPSNENTKKMKLLKIIVKVKNRSAHFTQSYTETIKSLEYMTQSMTKKSGES